VTDRQSRQRERGAEQGLSILGRIGLAGRTGFYLILTGITIRIAVFGGRSGAPANAHGALSLVSRPLIGKIAIGAVAAGFVLFGAGRLVGAVQDDTVSTGKRVLTALQGLFYLVLAYVPAAFLAGRTQTGSESQQQKTTAEILAIPGGRVLLGVGGLIFIAVCAQQIKGALGHDFRDGLELERAPGVVQRVAGAAGVVGITARALVFLPIGIFLIVAAAEANPSRSHGTDSELLALSGHPWGIALLGLVAAGLATFVVYSAIETGYRRVVSAR
jgi:hypothetical protein